MCLSFGAFGKRNDRLHQLADRVVTVEPAVGTVDPEDATTVIHCKTAEAARLVRTDDPIREGRSREEPKSTIVEHFEPIAQTMSPMRRSAEDLSMEFDRLHPFLPNSIVRSCPPA